MNLPVIGGLIVAYLGINHLYIKAINSIEGAPINKTDGLRSMFWGIPIRTVAQQRKSLIEKGLGFFARK